MNRHAPRPRSPRSGGFTLIEIVVVLFIFAVMFAMVATVTRGISAAQKRSLSGTRMAIVDAALVQFVQQQKRLPCPADGTLVSSHASAGLEGPHDATGCTTNQQHGVVPWRALALTEAEVTDGWERRLTYRVGPKLAGTGGMDMTVCDVAGTVQLNTPVLTCNPACIVGSNPAVSCTAPANFLYQKGLEVRSATNVKLMDPAAWPATGAAYVLISHGESGGGGYLNNGQLTASVVEDGTEEKKNYANLPFATNTTYYVDDSTSDTAGATHFDDVVSRPSVLNVVTKAGLGPRVH
jgi:prepilin-type N-terminal cleavage/methylation domain-containing protein